MKSKVAVIRCNSYELAEVRKAVAKGIDLIGGAGNFVKSQENIVLRVNLLEPMNQKNV